MLVAALPALAQPHGSAAQQPVEQPPAWSALTPAQRAALAPLRQDWAAIDAGRKQKWIEVSQKFPTLSQAERDRIQQRMAEWARMTPAERGRARLQFQESRLILPEERQALWEAYQALPQEERQALAARAASPASAAKAAPTRPEPRPSGPVAKQNVVPGASGRGTARPVAPTVVHARPGASTQLISRPPSPPAHHQAGLPKIAATQGFVDPATLLPMRGPQAAAVAGASVAATPAAPQPPEPEPEDGAPS
ncbi:MAG: hypothetical protein RI988_2291 [Pseudomonadota bacterium]|jgi:hypothetical protein